MAPAAVLVCKAERQPAVLKLSHDASLRPITRTLPPLHFRTMALDLINEAALLAGVRGMGQALSADEAQAGLYWLRLYLAQQSLPGCDGLWEVVRIHPDWIDYIRYAIAQDFAVSYLTGQVPYLNLRRSEALTWALQRS